MYKIFVRLPNFFKLFLIPNWGKPYIKCVGGKSQLIAQLDALLPADFCNWENAT